MGSSDVENASWKEMQKLGGRLRIGLMGKGDLLLCIRAFWGTDSLLRAVNV